MSGSPVVNPSPGGGLVDHHSALLRANEELRAAAIAEAEEYLEEVANALGEELWKLRLIARAISKFPPNSL